MVDLKEMVTRRGLFSTYSLANRIHIYIFVFLNVFLHMIQSNTNYFSTDIFEP